MDTESYKNRLTDMLSELETELKTVGVNDPTNPSDWVATPEGVAVGKADPNVVADQVEDWEERRSTVAALETRYNNIRRALDKIEAGTYGVCEISGEQIEADRLDANPAARTCKAHLNDESTLPK